eukprot:1683168-Rhodomonas_salina.1
MFIASLLPGVERAVLHTMPNAVQTLRTAHVYRLFSAVPTSALYRCSAVSIVPLQYHVRCTSR